MAAGKAGLHLQHFELVGDHRQRAFFQRRVKRRLALNSCTSPRPGGGGLGRSVSYGDAGRISLLLVGQDANVSLKVSNTGPEIPTAEIPALFNALQRGEDIRPDENRTSLGLGLFIVQQIATAHGGEVRCASSSKGTTFEILLPRTAISKKH